MKTFNQILEESKVALNKGRSATPKQLSRELIAANSQREPGMSCISESGKELKDFIILEASNTHLKLIKMSESGFFVNEYSAFGDGCQSVLINESDLKYFK